MDITKDIAAKVAAHFTQWVDPEEFAKTAESDLIYHQRHQVAPGKVFSFYIVAKGSQEIPLAHLAGTDNLSLVVTSDAISIETLDLLSSIEESWRKKGTGQLFEIQLVGDVVPEHFIREVKYACISFGSAEELVVKILTSRDKAIGVQGKNRVTDISELTADEIQESMRYIFKPFKKSGSVTVEEIV